MVFITRLILTGILFLNSLMLWCTTQISPLSFFPFQFFHRALHHFFQLVGGHATPTKPFASNSESYLDNYFAISMIAAPNAC